MSRPDWGALQQEYIAEYTRSGISPVAWCEARGLNYATARRYIKKLRKCADRNVQNCAKSAQKNLRRLHKSGTKNLRKKASIRCGPE